MVSEASHELARRGQQLYDERLRPLLDPAHLHAFVAIEPDSGEYFLGATLSEAGVAARKAHPGRLMYFVRVGHRCAVDIGSCRP
jgi:hypothetical protein